MYTLKLENGKEVESSNVFARRIVLENAGISFLVSQMEWSLRIVHGVRLPNIAHTLFQSLN